jgi:multicomponent Na+:H+ antiporter subunit G
MTNTLGTVLLIVGAAFLLLASIGVVRMPDLYMRMSAATKAATLGIGCMLAAVALHFSGFGVTSRAVATIVFFLLTAPVAAHMIGRAAYFVGVPLWSGTVCDELRGRYDPRTHELNRDPAGATASATHTEPHQQRRLVRGSIQPHGQERAGETPRA